MVGVSSFLTPSFLPSGANVAKGVTLGLGALVLRSACNRGPILEENPKKTFYAALQAMLFEGMALLGARGINEASKYLIGRTFSQLNVPLNVALVTLGITSFFIYMHEEPATVITGDTSKPPQTPPQTRRDQQTPPGTVYAKGKAAFGQPRAGLSATTPARVLARTANVVMTPARKAAAAWQQITNTGEE